MNRHEKNNSVIKVTHAFQHNVYVKGMLFEKKGETYCGHHHFYDHITIVAAGRVKVKFSSVEEFGLEEEEEIFDSFKMFVTRAFREHEITSLEDNTLVCCVHAIRDKDGEVLIPNDEYSSRKIAEMQKKGELMHFATNLTEEQKQKIFERAILENTITANSHMQLL